MPFSSLREKEFIDRREELAILTKRVLQAEKGQAQSLVLSGRRGVGKSELLKHLYGYLFWKQERLAPFYYAINPALLNASAFSKSFLSRFIYQWLAFQKKEQALLYQDGLSIDNLSAFVEDHDVVWAKDVLDQYSQSSGDATDSLRIALAAPRRSTLSTGIPVAVLIDDFHLIKGLHLDGVPDYRLVSLFQEPVSYGKNSHVIAGNDAELREIAVANGLERMLVHPLGPEGASSHFSALLHAHEEEGGASPLLLRHLGGNPWYLRCVVTRACAKKHPDETDFWNAYIQEVMEGALSLTWSAVLKGCFPNLRLRRVALAILYKICHTAEPLTCQRIAKSFSLAESQADDIAHALYLAGLLQGEFGVFRAIEDPVVRDIIESLYMKEILGKSARDVERYFLDKLLPQKEQVIRFDMTIPMAQESELVAAQCLEQIGKNLHLNQHAIGQLQIAVIEACINAMEHSRGMEKKVYVSVVAAGSHLEVSVESAGQEFIIQETGEPFGDRDAADGPKRGWGLKLIKNFADQVKYEKTAGGTKIVLVKNLEKSKDVQKEDRTNRE